MTMHYSDPARASDPHALPDVEVFYLDPETHKYSLAEGWIGYEAGWYWWSCFPGCLPEGDPIGPFESAEDAIADAQEIA